MSYQHHRFREQPSTKQISLVMRYAARWGFKFAYLAVRNPSLATVSTARRYNDILPIMEFGVSSENRAIVQSCGARIGAATHMGGFGTAFELHNVRSCSGSGQRCWICMGDAEYQCCR